MEKKADFMNFMNFIIFLVILFILNLIFLILVVDLGGASGYHTGIVTAVEYRKNVLWNSNLVYFKTSEESTQEDIYCVNNEILKNELIRLAEERKLVTIYFENDFIFLRSDCNGGESIIYEVKQK